MLKARDSNDLLFVLKSGELEKKDLTPEDVIANVLMKLKTLAEIKYDQAVESVVATHPTSYGAA